MAAAMRMIVLNPIPQNQKRRKTRREPAMAPAVSMARWMPNPFPLSAGIDSAMMASRGAVLIPFPTLSRPLKIRTWDQTLEKASRNLKTAEETYPHTTKGFLLPDLSDQ